MRTDVTNMNTKFVILAPSAIEFNTDCLLGEGVTEREAWLDAYGPTCNGRKPSKVPFAYCVEVTEEELNHLRWSSGGI